MRELPKKQFNDLLYKGYLESIKTSATLNEDKAIGISNLDLLKKQDFIKIESSRDKRKRIVTITNSGKAQIT